MSIPTQTALTRRRSERAAFTLLEAMFSLALTAIAGSALLLGTTASINATHDAVDQAAAQGLAQQLLDEIAGRRYCHDTNAYESSLGPSAFEAAGTARERYNDIDDYHGHTSTPPKDCWGVRLGSDNGVGGTRYATLCAPSTAMAHWRQRVQVYYVDNADLTQRLSSGTSNYRAIEVEIFDDDPVRGSRPLASVRRVVACIPSP